MEEIPGSVCGELSVEDRKPGRDLRLWDKR